MKTKFTPGPWKVSHQINGKRHVVRNDRQPGEFPLCLLPEGRIESERMANAKLIAAAPELYQALELLLVECDAHLDYVDDENMLVRVNEARAALSKARGE